MIGQKRNGGGGPRLNRYYEKLKPYYRIDHEKLEEPPSEQSTASSEEPAQRLPADKTLVFESRFESGNLRKAIKVAPFAYELYLKNDYGTHSFTQWYYFRV